MARTKKECLENSQKNKQYRLTAEIKGKKDGKSEFDVECKGDTNGWFTITTLKASDAPDSVYVKDRQGKTVVEIRSFDLSMQLTLPANNNRKELVVDLDYGDLCDIVTAFQAMEYLYNKRTGRKGKSPLTIGNVKAK